jgi:hypothetical protein
MLCTFLFLVGSALDDSQPLLTQELVDSINNHPHAPFKARLNPQFSKMTIGEAKKMLAPVRKSPGDGHGSPRPVGAHEGKYNPHDKKVFTGYYDVDGTGKKSEWTETNRYKYSVYDNSKFCSSWAPAVTSAMSLAISIHHKRFVELSVQFILDCDLLGDPCVERPPLNAYEQFWRRYIPQKGRWDAPADNYLRPPYFTLNRTTCDSKDGCYPGWSNCPRNLVMTGSCEPGQTDSNCPIYFLYNWRWIKSHLWEVGPVTSSILVRQSFFAYASGVYSALFNAAGSTTDIAFPKPESESLTAGPSGDMDDVLGMLDVTIIGWGQVVVNLSTDSDRYAAMYNRWWYVIPHLGTGFGEQCSEVFGGLNTTAIVCPPSGTGFNEGAKSGIMRFNRRFDDSSIESRAVGGVPFNFRPRP